MSSLLEETRHYFETKSSKVYATDPQLQTHLTNLADFGELRADAALLVKITNQLRLSNSPHYNFGLQQMWKMFQEYPAWILLDTLDEKFTPSYHLFRALANKYSVMTQLATLYHSSDSAVIQDRILNAITPLSYDKIADFVISVLNSENTIYNRTKAARLLYNKDAKETLERFKRLSLDQNYSAACEIFARFFGEEGEKYLPELLKLAAHKDYAVRYQAINSIASLGTINAANTLIELIQKDHDINNVAEGLRTLLSKKEEPYYDFIKEIYHTYPNLPEVIYQASLRHPDSQILPGLINRVSLPDSE